MKTFQEGRLRFAFGDAWQVEKFDSHRDYRERLQKLRGRIGGQEEGAKAIDFVARRTELPQPGLYFIEVKDYSEDRIQNHSDLIEALTLKVRDTISGLIVAYRTSSTAPTWKPFVDGLIDRECRLLVIWFVKLASRAEKTQKAHASVIVDKLKTKLRCVGARAFVVSDNLRPYLPEVTVESLPESGS
jgi:hypothetical protein